MVADDEADHIIGKIDITCGPQAVRVAFSSLSVSDKSPAAKIDAFFHRDENRVWTLSTAANAKPYDLIEGSNYLRKVMAEVESLDSFWNVICSEGDSDLQTMMRSHFLSKNPLTRLGEMRSFFQTHKEEFLAIEMLSLQNRGLKTLPKEIGIFKNIKTLNLSGNELAVLPSEISSLNQLRALNLSNNHFHSLPPQIGELTSLIYLYLSNNMLKTLPETIGHLSHLMILDLQGNHLGELPEGIGNLFSLRILHLENNRLEFLPISIGELRSLQLLYLYNNRIELLPWSIAGLTALTVLSAASNRMRQLPEEIGLLGSLKILVLDHNAMQDLPESIANLSNLQELYLNHNQIVRLPALPHVKNFGFEGNFCDSPVSQSLAMWDASSRFDEVYDLLEENKWKECIDGECHFLGPMVYDRGLHGRAVEPGYLFGMANLFRFLKANWQQNLDTSFYLKMHSICCAHFQGAATQTVAGQENVGVFRHETVSAAFSAPHYSMSQEGIEEFNRLNERLMHILGSSISLGRIVLESQSPLTWRIHYAALTQEQVGIIFNLFLCDFKCEMLQATCQEDRLFAIAKLIQHLEWLHPPKDGCGRTDTALLNFLLSKYDFYPVLLEYPYVSSCRGLSEWVEYLKMGMKNWQREVDLMRRQREQSSGFEYGRFMSNPFHNM